MTNRTAAPEAFSRVVIDAQLKDAGWVLTDGRSVRFEVMLPDGTKADYVLGDRHGRALAVLEAKRMAIDPLGAEKQARDYAIQLGIPFVFLANGKEIWFWDHEREAPPHQVKTIFSQPDLERRSAARQTQRDLMSVETDEKIAGRPYQRDCIHTLCREIVAGRRKMLVEMATGTGKTRTAAALIKRLFEAGIVTRVLFLVDRIPLARQTEDAFAEYLPDLPAYVKRAGLIPALFLDMFGDPATNPKKWPERRLSEVASVGSGAGFPKADQGQQGQQFPFLKVSDMNLPGNEVAIVAWNNTVSDEVRRRLNAKAFAAGSIIFPKIGAAIATNKKRILTVPSCVDNNLMAVTFESYLNVTFGLWLFQSKNISDFASASEPPSMRKTSVEEWAIPVPPFALQTAFAEQAQRLQATARALDVAAMKAEAMAAGLSAKVFKTGSAAALCDAA